MAATTPAEALPTQVQEAPPMPADAPPAGAAAQAMGAFISTLTRFDAQELSGLLQHVKRWLGQG